MLLFVLNTYYNKIL